MDWEDAEHRVVVPQSLRMALGVGEPILRWSRQKRELVLIEHAVDVPVIRGIGLHLEHWSYCGRERGASEMWRVLFTVKTRWYSLTLGRDRTGSLNVVTIFGSASTSFPRNRLRGMESVREREG